MEERAMLWMLSLVMFVGSCVAGSLPLVINLSEVRYLKEIGNVLCI